MDISVNDAWDCIASITEARFFVWQCLKVCNIHYINLISFLAPSHLLSSFSSYSLRLLILIPIYPSRINDMPGIISTDVVNPLLEVEGTKCRY